MRTAMKSIIVSAMAIVMLTVILVGTTFAWLSKSHEMDAINVKMQIESGKMKIQSFNIYKFIDNAEVNVTSNSAQHYLDEYDTIFTKRNEKLGMIYEIELTDIPAGATYVQVTGTADNSVEKGISKITYFKYLPVYGERQNKDTLRSQFGQGDVNSAFFTEGTVNFSIPLSGQGSAWIYLMLDYNPAEIKYVDISFTGESGSGFMGGSRPYTDNINILKFEVADK